MKSAAVSMGSLLGCPCITGAGPTADFRDESARWWGYVSLDVASVSLLGPSREGRRTIAQREIHESGESAYESHQDRDIR